MKKLVIKLSLGLFFLGMLSCDDTADGEITTSNGTGSIDEFLEINSVLSELESLGFSEVEREGSSTGRIGSRTAQECVDFAVATGENGTITYTYDFGEACEIGELALSGRVTTSFFIDDERNFEERTVYESFQMNDWSIDGLETVNGRYLFELGEGTFGFDVNYALSQQVSITACDGTSYDITSNTSTMITNSSKTVSVLDQTIETDNSIYTTSLEASLMQDFTCSRKEVYTYATGIVKTVSSEEELVIDYGDGTCDNLILVTENGNTTEIEASELVQFDFCD